MTKLIKIQII